MGPGWPFPANNIPHRSIFRGLCYIGSLLARSRQFLDGGDEFPIIRIPNLPDVADSDYQIAHTAVGSAGILSFFKWGVI